MRIKALIAPLILIGLPAVLLWRALFAGEVFVPARLLQDLAPWRGDWTHVAVSWNPLQSDGILQFYPWRSFAAESLRMGTLPLWNPHQFCGTPFIANAQSAIFYPPNLLFTVLPTPVAFGISAWLHLALTGSFAYLFLHRSLRRSRSASLFGAITWQLCTWQVSWLALPTFLCVSTWLPLSLLLAQRMISCPTPIRAIALGACLAVMIMAGHFQIFLYCFLFCLAYVLAEIASEARTAGADIGEAIGRRIGVGVLATAMMFLGGSVQLLPSIELSRMSHRAGGAVNWASYQGYLKLATPSFHLLSLIQPDFFGNPTTGGYWGATNYAENACYIGIVGIVMAVLGMAAWKALPQSRFFTIAAVVALLAAVGTPVDALLFFGIPGFSQTGSPGRILVLWSFCGAMLSAFGLDWLLEGVPKLALRRCGLAVVAILIIASGLLASLKVWTDQHIGVGTLATNLAMETDLWRVPLALLIAVLLLAGAVSAGKAGSTILGKACIAITSLDLLMAGIGYNPTARPSDVYPVTPSIAFLQKHSSEGRIMPVNRQWSILPSQPPPAVLPPNAATVYDLDDTQGYDSLFPGQYMAFAARLNGDSRSPAPQENGNMVFTHGIGSSLAREAGARYIVTLGSDQELPTGLNEVMNDGFVSIYEDPRALARVTDGAGNALPYHDISCNALAVQAPATGDSIVVHDQFYPGWRAIAGGIDAVIRPAPDIFRTISMPSNASRFSQVKLTFSPNSVRCGIYGLCFCCAVVGGVLGGWFRSRRPIRNAI